MSRVLLPLVLLPLAACSSASGELSGSAGGITWGDTSYAFFGSQFIVFSNLETSCQDIDWINNNYDDGSPASDSEQQILQFAFAGGAVAEGTFPVAAVDADVHATIIAISGGAQNTPDANGGILTVDSLDEEDSVSGSFDSVTFEDGSVSGTFTADWCVNLKP